MVTPYCAATRYAARVRRIASLFVEIDRAAPLAAQLRDALRRALERGALAPGARLPPSRELAAELRLSRTTVVAALGELCAEGWLEARPRSGLYVAREPPRERVAAPGAAAAAAPSPLRLSRRVAALAREAEARRAAGPRPLAFRLSRPALGAFPVREWSRVLSRRAAAVTVAQLDYGHESAELRAAIAELVSTGRGMRVAPEQVLIVDGAQRALELAARAVLDEGDAAWMEDPGYPGARAALAAAGARVVAVPVDAEGLDVARGAALAPRARLAYVTPSCQFPLAVTLSRARRERLLAWAEQAGACVVEDDYDCDFTGGGEAQPAIHALDRRGRVLYVSSFSRTLFPAIRLGFMIAPDGLVDRLRAARAALEETLPSLPQLALADFIADGSYARHLRRMKVAYRARRAALAAAIAEVGAPLALRPTPAGLHVVADLPPGTDAEAVEAAAARRGVEAVALSRFAAGRRRLPPALVLGFGAVHPSRARDAVARLAAAIAEERRR
jgi:GntR family transcriptional regulator/MocR family aminotransferase